jgi:hypothetical protein
VIDPREAVDADDLTAGVNAAGVRDPCPWISKYRIAVGLVQLPGKLTAGGIGYCDPSVRARVMKSWATDLPSSTPAALSIG